MDRIMVGGILMSGPMFECVNIGQDLLTHCH